LYSKFTFSSGGDQPCAFLFTGPSGVGKIYLSKHIALAQKRAFVYFDLSTYNSKSKLEELLTFPPQLQQADYNAASAADSSSTVNNNNNSPNTAKEGQINHILKMEPNAVIVLNHVEKAYPTFYAMMNKLFEKGYLTKPFTGKKHKRRSKHSSNNEAESSESAAEVPLINGEEIYIDARQAIFVFVTDISDEVIMKVMKQTSKEEEELMATKNKQLEELLRHYTAMDTLDRVTEFRKQITPMLVDHFSNQSRGGISRVDPNVTGVMIEKDFSSLNSAVLPFINRINSIIPFFPFANQQVLYSILSHLDKFVQIGANSERSIKLSYDSDVVVWLMKRCQSKVSISVKDMIDNHILTPLAKADQEIESNDSVQLQIGKQNKLQLLIQNTKTRKYKVIQSKL